MEYYSVVDDNRREILRINISTFYALISNQKELRRGSLEECVKYAEFFKDCEIVRLPQPTHVLIEIIYNHEITTDSPLEDRYVIFSGTKEECQDHFGDGGYGSGYEIKKL